MTDLPPLDQPQAYVVVGPNDQRGPYTMELLISEVLAGRLSEATPVWWPGLADWTTMGAHQGVVDELARRRAAAAAPAWAEPAPAAPDPYAQPAADQYAQPAPDPYAQPAADPYAQPAADQYAQPAAAPVDEQSQPVADPFAPPAAAPAEDDAEVVDAEVIEVDEIVVVDPAHHEAFAALVARSATRADRQAQVDSVNESLIDAVVQGVSSQGFELAERVDVDRGTELRFDEGDGGLVMTSLGRAVAVRADDLRDDHVPITLTYRSAVRQVTPDTGSGEHGDIVVASDEWTGQSTSSVSLFLALGDYLDDALQVDADAVVRDVGATVAVLRSKLG